MTVKNRKTTALAVDRIKQRGQIIGEYDDEHPHPIAKDDIREKNGAIVLAANV